MSQTADVVVIGAGIMGSSIAFQLGRRSDLRVVVVDKAAGPATGSTGASAAITRCRYTEPLVVRLARQSQDAYAAWPEFTRLDEVRNQLTRTGGLWVFDRDHDELEADVAKLTEHGVAARAMTRAEVEERWPELHLCVSPIDLTGDSDHECRLGEAFLYEENAGFMDPHGANQDLVDAARANGVEVRFNAALTGFRTDGSRIAGVELDGHDPIAAELVINASGPWCNPINEMAGVELDWTLTPTRIQMVHRAWPVDGPSLPIVFDGSTQSAWRREASGQQMLVATPEVEPFAHPVDDPDSFRTTPDPDAVAVTMASFQHRVPGVEHKSRLTGVCGLYTINEEDNHPIVGPSGVDGFWVANGFSGHGFKLAPGIGSMIAQAHTGQTASFDTDVPISLFARDREPLDSGGNVFA